MNERDQAELAALVSSAVTYARNAARFQNWVARKHKEQNKELKQRLDELERACARLGVPLAVQPQRPDAAQIAEMGLQRTVEPGVHPGWDQLEQPTTSPGGTGDHRSTTTADEADDRDARADTRDGHDRREALRAQAAH